MLCGSIAVCLFLLSRTLQFKILKYKVEVEKRAPHILLPSFLLSSLPILLVNKNYALSNLSFGTC